jgi:hypothetical protein
MPLNRFWVLASVLFIASAPLNRGCYDACILMALYSCVLLAAATRDRAVEACLRREDCMLALVTTIRLSEQLLSTAAACLMRILIVSKYGTLQFVHWHNFKSYHGLNANSGACWLGLIFACGRDFTTQRQCVCERVRACARVLLPQDSSLLH